MNPLVVIPARGGSKGVIGKNTKLLGDVPLLHYTIEAAKAIFSQDLIYVSTDSLEIKQEAEKTGLTVPFIRPSYLATDTADIRGVLLHALKFAAQSGYHADQLVLLQPTSPFRTEQHIREALTLCTEEVDMVVSVKETKANPYYVLFEETQEGFLEKSKVGTFARRQDCPKVYEYNGAIYIMKCETLYRLPISDFPRVIKYVMDELYSLDIDTVNDWKYAEFLIAEGLIPGLPNNNL